MISLAAFAGPISQDVSQSSIKSVDLPQIKGNVCRHSLEGRPVLLHSSSMTHMTRGLVLFNHFILSPLNICDHNQRQQNSLIAYWIFDYSNNFLSFTFTWLRLLKMAHLCSVEVRKCNFIMQSLRQKATFVAIQFTSTDSDNFAVE